MKPCYLYIILCRNGNYYTGISIDYLWRWKNHHRGSGARYVRAFGFYKPVFLQKFDNKSLAMRKEYYVKKQNKEWKEKLINSNKNLLITDPNKLTRDWTKQGYKGKMPWVI